MNYEISKCEQKLVSDKQIEKLTKVVKGGLLTDEPMREHTSLRVGGLADVIVFPENTDDLRRTIMYLSGERLPYFVLGNGTNLLVRDGGIREVVITLKNGFKRIKLLEEVKSNRLFAEASAPLVSLLRFSMDHGFSGLEFSAGIPGTVGGGLVMNAGSHLGELKDVTCSITILNPNGQVTVNKRECLNFSYRNLEIAKGSIILSAVFGLRADKKSRIEKKVQEILIKRKETQPLDFPNAGSIFKNPEGVSAGKLIDEVGFKGLQIGGARVSKLHANFILNLGNATANDILNLIKEIQKGVYQKTGTMLEPEIRVVGEAV